MIKKIFFPLIAALASLTSFPSFLQAEDLWIETCSIEAVSEYVDKNTLVLFNITGTLYEPSSTVGDHLWRQYFAERVMQLADNKDDAQALIDKVKNLIVNHIPKKAVQESIPSFIADLQSNQIPVLGITQKSQSTSYANDFGLITRNHLLSIGIDLEKTLTYYNVLTGDRGDNCSFADGILFTEKQPVGPALIAFFKRIKMVPSKIVMIDDSSKSLESAMESLQSTGIEFVAVNYLRAKYQHPEFDPVLGIIEFFAFINEGEIMKDEEAMQIKLSQPATNFKALLDSYIRCAGQNCCHN